ncbi:MAG: N-acetyltransferase family protein [Bacillota bacterium]
MIRPYSPTDLEAIVDMVHEDDRMPADDIKERVEKWTTLVWDDGGVVKGAASYQKVKDGEFSIRVFADPGCRHKGIGSELLNASLAGVKEMHEPGRVTVKYRLDRGESQRFFRNRGFAYWYSMDYLAYEGPAVSLPDLPSGVEIAFYEDRHYEEFFRVMAETFLPQRRFFDFRPHDVREFHKSEDDRKRVLANKNNMLVLLEHGRLVGISELEGNFIDTVGIDLAAKGRGYGRALMLGAMNLLRARGHEVIETSVVLGNVPAWRLYNTLGFKRVQADEWACMWI